MKRERPAVPASIPVCVLCAAAGMAGCRRESTPVSLIAFQQSLSAFNEKQIQRRIASQTAAVALFNVLYDTPLADGVKAQPAEKKGAVKGSYAQGSIQGTILSFAC